MTFVTEDRVISDLTGTDKLAVLRELSRPLVKACGLGSVEELAQVLLEREKIESTGIGDGIAIPHGRVRGLKDFVISFARSTKGIDFDSIDHKPAHLFFLVMAPENSAANQPETLEPHCDPAQGPFLQETAHGSAIPKRTFSDHL